MWPGVLGGLLDPTGIKFGGTHTTLVVKVYTSFSFSPLSLPPLVCTKTINAVMNGISIKACVMRRWNFVLEI
jgi:hypothetical protein